MGEKVSEADAAAAITAAIQQAGLQPSFAQLVPFQPAGTAAPGYDIVLDFAGDRREPTGTLDAFAAAVEASLCETNYHYRHARAMGQLRATRVVIEAGAAQAHLVALSASGLRAGSLKILALGQSRP